VEILSLLGGKVFEVLEVPDGYSIAFKFSPLYIVIILPLKVYEMGKKIKAIE
jgi:hypothetical protein